MSSASVTTRPPKPSESRSTPVSSVGVRVAGRTCPLSMPGSAMWADITAATPLLMAARKGTSSTESSRLHGASMTGSEMWVSVPVSP